MQVRRALLSVSDKSGIVEFAQGLAALGIEIISTGGTAAALTAAGIAVKDVASHTGFPEIMGGRVKTLHPLIHGGLLGRRGIDEQVMADHGIAAIDLLAVNLYPFAQTVARADCSVAEAIENIDIGGPAMVRAAAKNHDAVTVLVDPTDYAAVLAALRASGETDASLRRRLAAKAYAHTAAYDTMVAAYLNTQGGAAPAVELPETLTLAFKRLLPLRYGENPHQQAAFYRDPAGNGVGSARLLQGKELSYNNIADADTAIECARRFAAPACVIVKHANPCGVAVRNDLAAAYEAAYRTDPTSAFGGIIACNREIDEVTARLMIERQFIEVLAAPSFSTAALTLLAGKPNLRVLATGELGPGIARLEYRSVNGGLLAQTSDELTLRPGDFKIVSQRVPGKEELGDLEFAWQVCQFVKSNAIVFARDRATVGVGAGQMSRVYSTRIAAIKATDENIAVAGAVMASDAFFPFRDGIDTAAGFGIRAVIQPGGSKRDDEVIAAANEHGMAMLFTGVRHFRH
ncbi:MAG: bifunctional phosphoribosylaminoimidazolecarboxamide formyltransferase/IMP cyclohydrolase [Steroidobacteraceae bacterium]